MWAAWCSVLWILQQLLLFSWEPAKKSAEGKQLICSLCGNRLIHTPSQTGQACALKLSTQHCNSVRMHISLAFVWAVGNFGHWKCFFLFFYHDVEASTYSRCILALHHLYLDYAELQVQIDCFNTCLLISLWQNRHASSTFLHCNNFF